MPPPSWMNFYKPLPDGFIRRCEPPDAARLRELGKRANMDEMAPDAIRYSGRTTGPSCLTPKRSSGRRGTPIICRETGTYYAKMNLAADELECPPAEILQAVRLGCRCRGLHWRYAKAHEHGNVKAEGMVAA